MRIVVAIYLVGVVLALILWDHPPGRRLVLALVWPLGLVAFAAAVVLLLVALVVARPLVGVVLIALVGAVVSIVAILLS